MAFSSLRDRLKLDPYLLALAGTVALAALLPAQGASAEVLDNVVTVAIAVLFFLYGARFAPQAVFAGLAHWRLQSIVFLSTYLLFPILGLVATWLLRPYLAPELALGLIFVCALPSTVQSSVAFTSIARGNVPAALCSASVSNLAGVVLTPALLTFMMGTHGIGAGQAQRFLSAHDGINNLFHLRRDHLTASEYRAARSRAFEVWSDTSGAAARA